MNAAAAVRLRQAVRAEWTKLCTVPGPGLLLVPVLVLTVVVSAVAVAGTTCPPGNCAIDAARLGLTGVLVGQAGVAMFAVLLVGSEYSTGTIHATLAAVPRRGFVLAAKSLTATAPVLLCAALAVLGSLGATRLIEPEHGLGPVSLSDGPTLRAAVGSVLYLGLIGLLSLGIALAVRSAAASVGTVLGLLYLFPLFLMVVTDPDWKRRIEQIAPSNAGLAIQSTTNLDTLPIGPWAGLGVLAAWSAAALIAGGLVLRLRDA
jgi:ABC-2 type transport system permease protein